MSKIIMTIIMISVISVIINIKCHRHQHNAVIITMLTTMFNQKHLNMKSATDVINKLLKTYFAIPVWSSL